MDRREAILAQLFTVLQAIPDFAAVYRNRPINPAAATRPALFIMDAHESRDDSFAQNGGAFRSLGITGVRMTPEIFISLGAAPEDVGPQLNALRILVLKAIFADILPGDTPQVAGSLGDLVSGGGDIFYEGAATALTMASGVDGEMAVSVTFSYPLKPTEF